MPLSGKYKQSLGYLWRYEGYDESTIPQALLDLQTKRGSTKPEAVEQLDPVTCERIAVFRSMNEAERMTGVDRSSIRCFLNGKAAHAGGYLWRRLGSTKKLIPYDEAPNLRKPVEQLHAVTGELIERFESIAEAVKMTGVPSANIRSAANGNDRYAHGYLWRYEGDEGIPELFDKVPTVEKRVEQIDPESGQVLATFESVKEASSATKANRSSISAVVNGKGKTAGGYFWRAKGDD
jgi:hypothetical protein